MHCRLCAFSLFVPCFISNAKEAHMAKRRDELKKKRSSFFSFGGKKDNKEEDPEDTYDDQEEIHSLQMGSKKIEAYRRENEQLFYSMSGAEIFFKRTDVDT